MDESEAYKYGTIIIRKGLPLQRSPHALMMMRVER